MEIININNIDYQIDKLDTESNLLFYDRINFIKRYFLKTQDIKESIRLSKIYTSYKYLNCKYPYEVFKKIKDF